MIRIQEIFFFFDDSGVLHKNDQSGYFVYGGYCFLDKFRKEDAKRKYRALELQIKKSLGLSCELKACNIEIKHKRALFNVMKYEESIASVVNISRVYDHILSEKKSIHRYKDYMLKRGIKSKLNDLIKYKKINPYEDTVLRIYVDEQATATDGYYDLRSSIFEELKVGVSNFDYGYAFQPIFFGHLQVEVHFCDSRCNYLIQASDIFANRIWYAHVTKNNELKVKDNHTYLLLP